MFSRATIYALRLSASAALLTVACLALSWRQTPEQRRNITWVTWNAANATYQLARASAHANAAVAPLADPKTGISPSMSALTAAVRDGAAQLKTGVGSISDLAETLNSQVQAIGKAVVPVIHSADGMMQSADGSVRSAGALVKDAQDSLDDSYWDLKATIESANVAATSVAQTAETVRNAAPEVAASVQGIGKSADGIAADVKREADEITKPKKWWQKALGPVYTVGRLVAAFL